LASSSEQGFGGPRCPSKHWDNARKRLFVIAVTFANPFL